MYCCIFTNDHHTLDHFTRQLCMCESEEKESSDVVQLTLRIVSSKKRRDEEFYEFSSHTEIQRNAEACEM